MEKGFAPDEPIELTKELNRFLLEHSFGGKDLGSATEPVLWKNHKADYAAYWAYWPVDMLIYVLGDLLRDIWNWIAKLVEAKFNAYSSKQMLKPIDHKE
jgi:hypothetical protein